MQQQNEVNGT